MTLTTQQKAFALNALVAIAVKINGLDQWYVDQDVSVGKAGENTRSNVWGTGDTPEEAINNHWDVLIETLTEGEYLALENGGKYLWNGFMWQEVTS